MRYITQVPCQLFGVLRINDLTYVPAKISANYVKNTDTFGIHC